MRRSKKLIIAAVLVAVILAGSIGGAVLANDNEDNNQPAASSSALWDRVAAIYEENTNNALDLQALKDAFAEAQGEMRAQAVQDRLNSLVEQGKITPEEAKELQDWWNLKPKDVPFEFGFGGSRGFRGMGGPRGFWGPCAPVE